MVYTVIGDEWRALPDGSRVAIIWPSRNSKHPYVWGARLMKLDHERGEMFGDQYAGAFDTPRTVKRSYAEPILDDCMWGPIDEGVFTSWQMLQAMGAIKALNRAMSEFLRENRR